ncbi:MAG TPA: lysylphosphatidylglycerol synthase domain-containing protein [Bacillota bacterium]|nr:lysylphosphatidylglycerol synthase domain-containing protein [Bacillota bacterium]
MKKLHGVLLLLGLAFLAYLLWRIGLGELGHELGSLGWGLIPLILSEGAAELIHTAGWRHCLSGSLRSVPLMRLFSIRMAGYAINYLTPTASLGGEITKAALLAGNQRGPEAVSGVLLGKLCFGLAHLLFVCLGAVLVLWRLHLPWGLWVGMLISSGLVALGMGIFLLLQKRGQLGGLMRWLAARRIGGPALQRAAGAISEVDAVLQASYRDRPRELCLAIGWHLLGYSLGIVQAWLFFRLLTPNASWTLAAGIWFFGMWFDLVTFAVPLNLGTLEGSRILVLKAFGYSALLGMTYGVALRLAQLCWAAFGLATHGWLAAQAVDRPAASSVAPSRPEGQEGPCRAGAPAPGISREE